MLVALTLLTLEELASLEALSPSDPKIADNPSMRRASVMRFEVKDTRPL